MGSPSAGDLIATIKSGTASVKVKGIAWGGGGSGINRVDVSLDSGKTFTRADVLDKPVDEARRSQWSWVFFEKEVSIPDEMRQQLQKGERVYMTLVSKALNSAWNVQPENHSSHVNAHGCCVNHWCQVPVARCPIASAHKKAQDGDFGNIPSGGRFAMRFRHLDKPAEADQRINNECSQPHVADQQRVLSSTRMHVQLPLQALIWMISATLRRIYVEDPATQRAECWSCTCDEVAIEFDLKSF